MIGIGTWLAIAGVPTPNLDITLDDTLGEEVKTDGKANPGESITLEAEITPSLINRRGALVAARQGDQVNPERRSSGSQFYVVQGRPLPEEMLTQAEMQINQSIGGGFSYTDAQREIYVTKGGAPWLDMQYSVFGELVEVTRGEGAAALIATHNLDLAAKMDRIVLLHDGKLLEGAALADSFGFI